MIKTNVSYSDMLTALELVPTCYDIKISQNPGSESISFKFLCKHPGDSESFRICFNACEDSLFFDGPGVEKSISVALMRLAWRAARIIERSSQGY